MSAILTSRRLASCAAIATVVVALFHVPATSVIRGVIDGVGSAMCATMKNLFRAEQEFSARPVVDRYQDGHSEAGLFE